MALNFENWYDLTDAVKLAKPINTFVKDTFFSRKKTAYHNIVKWSREEATDGLARLQIKDGPAKLVGKSTKSVRTFELPGTYEKMNFTIQEYDDYKRLGGSLVDTGDGGKVTQFNKWVLEESLKLRDRVRRRQEQMCIEAMSTGALDITEDGITYEVDYDFPAANKPGLIAASDRWTHADSDPIAQIAKFSNIISKKTGLNVDTVILGSDAAENFIANAKVRTALDTLNFQAGRIDATANANQYLGAKLLTVLPGGINVYVHNQQYTNASDATADMLNSKAVVLTSTQAVGAGAYEWINGTINRFVPNSSKVIQTVELFANVRTSEDNKMVIFEVESKGAPLIKIPEAIYTYLVIA